jgi:single-stranded-DNA-specific exonuclease
LKFKNIGVNDYSLENAIKVVFENRNVKNPKELLKVTKDNVIHYSKLKNIELAVNLLLEEVKKDNHLIYVQVDSDADGYTSSSVLIQTLKRLIPNVNIKYRLHDGKQHGIIVKEVPKEVTMVIIPDAGSNQISEHKELKQRGINVIVLDHHELNDEYDYNLHTDAVIVNPRLSPEHDNKDIAGVGVVYKFCKALCEKLDDDFSDEFLDLVAIGTIGDLIDLRSKESRFFVKEGLDNINNKLLKALIDEQSFSMNGIVNITSIGWYIAPLINACIRVGKDKEKELMFEALLNSDEEIYYKKNDEMEHISVSVARNLGNIKARQKRNMDKELIQIEEYIQNNKLHLEKVMILNVDGLLSNNLSGLVANKFAQKYKRPVMFLRTSGEGELSGSSRGYDKGEVKNFNEYLLQSNVMISCEGHPNAFGATIKQENIDKLKNYFNSTLLEPIGHTEIDVDFIVPCQELDIELVKKIAMFRDEWGGTLFEPKIGITDVIFGYNDLTLTGKYNNLLKTKINGISATKPYFNRDKFNELFGDGETFVCDLLVTFKLNEYQGNLYPVVQIEEINVKETLYF